MVKNAVAYQAIISEKGGSSKGHSLWQEEAAVGRSKRMRVCIQAGCGMSCDQESEAGQGG